MLRTGRSINATLALPFQCYSAVDKKKTRALISAVAGTSLGRDCLVYSAIGKSRRDAMPSARRFPSCVYFTSMKREALKANHPTTAIYIRDFSSSPRYTASLHTWYQLVIPSGFLQGHILVGCP